jgi:cellulose synthase/poly-beta-1,6-N-acetylglucosamine synthase-like glycosyltransferase
MGLLLFGFLIQVTFFVFIYSKAAKKSPELNRRVRKYPSLSVIICARNEAENLRQKLPFILEQNYPEFEVIVVDDCSDDDTNEILENFSKKYSVLKVSKIKKDPKFSHGKKLALTIGIKAAKYDTLLLTDADCEPAGKDWMKYMSRNFSDQKNIVLGIGLYKKKKGFLNVLIRFETAFIAMQYAGFARSGKPYMGVGRNLSYKKELFFKNKGFASHLGLESGDDDLFINEVSNSYNTVVENNPQSFTYSEPEIKLRNWIRQKKRHLTTGRFYQQSVKRILGLEYMTRILLLLSFIALLIRKDFHFFVLGVYILSLIIKSIIYIIVFKRFGEKFLFLPAIFIGELTPFLYSYLHFTNYIERKRSRWQ